MWRSVACLVFLAVAATGQPLTNLLLPQPVHIEGRVVDEGGNPIAGAGVDHVTTDARKAYETDAEGRFDLNTVAPSFVIRKAGYRSQWMPTRPLADARIVLEKLGTNFLICPDKVIIWRSISTDLRFSFRECPTSK